MSLESLTTLSEGTERGVSDWLQVTQADVDTFAGVTRDEDRYHIDPEWAQDNSPLGMTISFGFFTMSLLSNFVYQVFDQHGITTEELSQVFNFGFNRLRLPAPVPVGAEIRGCFVLAGTRRRRPSGHLEVTLTTTIEIRDSDRPALVADWLFVEGGQ